MREEVRDCGRVECAEVLGGADTGDFGVGEEGEIDPHLLACPAVGDAGFAEQGVATGWADFVPHLPAVGIVDGEHGSVVEFEVLALAAGEGGPADDDAVAVGHHDGSGGLGDAALRDQQAFGAEDELAAGFVEWEGGEGVGLGGGVPGSLPFEAVAEADAEDFFKWGEDLGDQGETLAVAALDGGVRVAIVRGERADALLFAEHVEDHSADGAAPVVDCCTVNSCHRGIDFDGKDTKNQPYGERKEQR